MLLRHAASSGLSALLDRAGFAEHRFEDESGHVAEHRVVGDQRDAEPHCRGSDPTVRIVGALGECVSRGFALGAELA